MLISSNLIELIELNILSSKNNLLSHEQNTYQGIKKIKGSFREIYYDHKK